MRLSRTRKFFSVKDETHETIDDEFNEGDLYELEKLMKNNDISLRLKSNSKLYMI